LYYLPAAAAASLDSQHGVVESAHQLARSMGKASGLGAVRLVVGEASLLRRLLFSMARKIFQNRWSPASGQTPLCGDFSNAFARRRSRAHDQALGNPLATLSRASLLLPAPSTKVPKISILRRK
jgi:hypothetical protein